MSNKIYFQGGATTYDLAMVAGGVSILESVKRYNSMSVAAQLVALETTMRPVEALRKQIEAWDISGGIRAAMKQATLADVHHSAMLASNSSVLEQIRHHAEVSSATAQLAKSADPAVFTRIRAVEEMLAPSKIAAKYLEDLTRCRAIKLAAEQASRWSNPSRELIGALERFKEPLGVSSARALLESLVKANESFGMGYTLDEAAQLPESEATREEVVHFVHGVTEGISKALTLQDAVNQIVLEIQAAKEPLRQRLFFAVLVPFLMAVVFAFVNPVVDFYVKKQLENSPKQAENKQVKEAAREAVGDVRMLSDFRFVSAQSLALRLGPKAKAQAIGNLRFGQTVRVLDKERDFTLVVWRSEDGKVEIQGWVFSRYLKRFT